MPDPVCVAIARENREIYEAEVARMDAWMEAAGEYVRDSRSFVARLLAVDLATERAHDQAEFDLLVAGIAVALESDAP